MDAMDALDVQPNLEAPLAPKDEVATSININGTQPDDIVQASLRIPPRPQGSASSSLPIQDPPPPSEQGRDGANNIEDMVSAHLASVLAVIPDVQPEHAAALIHEWVVFNKLVQC